MWVSKLGLNMNGMSCKGKGPKRNEWFKACGFEKLRLKSTSDLQGQLAEEERLIQKMKISTLGPKRKEMIRKDGGLKVHG